MGICHDPPTLPKTTIACENGPFQKESSLPTTIFSGAMSVSGRVFQCHPSPFPPAQQNKWSMMKISTKQNHYQVHMNDLLEQLVIVWRFALVYCIYFDLVFDTQASENMWVQFFQDGTFKIDHFHCSESPLPMGPNFRVPALCLQVLDFRAPRNGSFLLKHPFLCHWEGPYMFLKHSYRPISMGGAPFDQQSK